MSSKSADKWKDLRELTLKNLPDIRKVYEDFGLKFTGKISSKSWAECHAWGREDSNPSAAVNLETGVYKDFAGQTMNIFDFMAHCGKVATWQDAQTELAKMAGLGSKIPKKSKAKRPDEVLGFTQKFNPGSTLGLCKKYGVRPDILEMTGARIARYPANSAQPQVVVAFPIYSPISLLEQPPESYVIQNSYGEPLMVFQGPESPPRAEKRITLGGTGVLNRWALEHWEKAERIYKVEGVSDMLVMQQFIPPELREKHIVITNACGTDDSTPPFYLAPHCSGKEIIIIHDADIPGQFGTGKDKTGGAQRWITAMRPAARVLKNVQLPYEIQQKHGKDLRDWINEPGRTYADLQELVSKTSDIQKTDPTIQDDGKGATRELTKSELILHRLQIAVLGHRQAGRTARITCYSYTKRKTFEIVDINKKSRNDLLTDLGEVVKVWISDPENPDPMKHSISEVREAIAYEASHRILDADSSVGIGFWHINGKMVMIGAGKFLTMNGSLSVHSSPSLEDKVVQFGSQGEEWFDVDAITGYLPMASDADWRKELFEEIAGIFELWGNFSLDPQELKVRCRLLAGLLLATWIQDVWHFRPWVSLTGEANSGKSAMFNFFFRPYFGPLATTGTTMTEAGLRAMTRECSKAVLLDELETSPGRDRILDYLRNSGSGGGKTIGSPGQHAITSKIKCIPWMSATEANMKKETERSRYISFTMENRANMPVFDLPAVEKLVELRNKSHAALLRTWFRATELEYFIRHKCTIPGISHRYTETHAVPIAMWSAMLGHNEIECGNLFKAAMQYMIEPIKFSTEPEHITLIQQISCSRIPVGRGNVRTVSELLTDPAHRLDNDDTPEQVLARHGIRKMWGKEFRVSADGQPPVHPDRCYVFLAHRMVIDLLRGTDFQHKGIDQLLRRITGAFQSQQRIGKTKARGIVVPFTEMVSEVSPSESIDNFVPPEHRPPQVGGSTAISEIE